MSCGNNRTYIDGPCIQQIALLGNRVFPSGCIFIERSRNEERTKSRTVYNTRQPDVFNTVISIIYCLKIFYLHEEILGVDN